MNNKFFGLGDAIKWAASEGLVLKQEVPLLPLFLPQDASPRKSERVDLTKAADLPFVVREVSKSSIFTTQISNGIWAVIAVLAAYSHAFHAMLMEVGDRRYLPAPEFLPDPEGDCLMELAVEMLKEAEMRSAGGTVCFGWNWSPRWGRLEEVVGGLMSIATKWHPQIWSWWPEPDYGQIIQYNHYRAEWVSADTLGEKQRLVVMGNTQSELLGRFVGELIRRDFNGRDTADFDSSGLLNFADWSYTGNGIVAPFRVPLADLLHSPHFFSRVLKPIARVLNGAFADLTGAFTAAHTDEISVLRNAECRPLTPTELELVRAVPPMRPAAQINVVFREKRWPVELLECLLPLVQARCAVASDHPAGPVWRKGFGYALVLSGSAWGSGGEMRIMPVAHLGPAGVVEAHGIALERVKQYAPLSELRRKGAELCALGCRLEAKFGRAVTACAGAV